MSSRCGGGVPTPATSCCSTGALAGIDPITRDLYDSVQTRQLPEAAVLPLLGCDNPTALAELTAGEEVEGRFFSAFIRACKP